MSRIAAVRKNYSCLGDTAWEVFIPSGPTRRLFYLTRNAQLNARDTSARISVELSPGKHLIEHRVTGKIGDRESEEGNLLFVDEKLVSTESVFSHMGLLGADDGSVQNLKTGAVGEPFVIVANGGIPTQIPAWMWIE